MLASMDIPCPIRLKTMLNLKDVYRPQARMMAIDGCFIKWIDFWHWRLLSTENRYYLIFGWQEKSCSK